MKTQRMAPRWLDWLLTAWIVLVPAAFFGPWLVPQAAAWLGIGQIIYAVALAVFLVIAALQHVHRPRHPQHPQLPAASARRSKKRPR